MKTPALLLRAFLLGLVLLAVPAAGWAQASKPGWSTDAARSFAKARAEKKLVLMDFTGSDWCPWCVRMDKEVFSTPEFIRYAKDNLVLLELDYPHRKEQSPQLRSQNQALAQQYGVSAFPTLVVLGANGRRLRTIDGYLPGGAKALLAELGRLKAAGASTAGAAPASARPRVASN